MLLLVFLAVIFTCPAALAQTFEPAPEVAPIVKFRGGEISVCGVETKDAAGLAVRLELHRGALAPALIISAAAPDTRTELMPGAVMTINPVTVAGVRISGFETARFKPFMDGGDVMHSGSAEEAGFIIQRFMIAGGAFELEQSGRRSVFEVKGPLPQSVRAAYLNCTGDMYRQE